MTDTRSWTPDVPAAHYHQDNVGNLTPSLSSSIAKILVTASPAHAFIAHPRLNPAYVKDDDPKFDLGTVVHQLFLEGVDRVEVIECNDWKTKAAQEQRDLARAAGGIPLLAKHYEAVGVMVASIQDQLEVHPAVPPLFQAGAPEQTLVWEEDGVLCRCRPDWLHDSRLHCDDLKTTAVVGGAKPDRFQRHLFAMGYDLQAAFYLRGIRAVYGVEATWRWCVVETCPPYGLSVVTPGEDVLAIGDAKVSRALELWRGCLEAGVWPSYPAEVAVVEAPSWETRWLMTPELEALAWEQI